MLESGLAFCAAAHPLSPEDSRCELVCFGRQSPGAAGSPLRPCARRTARQSLVGVFLRSDPDPRFHPDPGRESHASFTNAGERAVLPEAPCCPRVTWLLEQQKSAEKGTQRGIPSVVVGEKR